jgi:hypothetical protein
MKSRPYGPTADPSDVDGAPSCVSGDNATPTDAGLKGRGQSIAPQVGKSSATVANPISGRRVVKELKGDEAASDDRDEAERKQC